MANRIWHFWCQERDDLPRARRHTLRPSSALRGSYGASSQKGAVPSLTPPLGLSKGAVSMVTREIESWAQAHPA